MFTAFAQYFVEAPLAPITALSISEYDAASLAHLFLGSFRHSSLQNLSSSIRLDGECRCTAIFRSLRDAQSGSSLGSGGPLKNIHRAIPWPLRCYLGCVLRVVSYLGCVLRVVVLLEDEPSPQSEVQHRFSSWMSLYIHLSLDPDESPGSSSFPLILTSLPVPHLSPDPD